MRDFRQQNIIIIGAGFYGCSIALYLKARGFNNISILEREDSPMKRASYSNQARVHKGFHYPRSFITGLRSSINFARFNKEYGFAIKKDFVNLYAISKKNSKISAFQFERFAQDIGTKIEDASSNHSSYFNRNLIDKVYLAEEFCFDSKLLKEYFLQKIDLEKISLTCNAAVRKIEAENGKICVLYDRFDEQNIETADMVLNCTYSGLNSVLGQNYSSKLKHEFTELCLIDPPEEFRQLGITVMDGAFFSMMPFPAEGCHSLSHVNYTPFSYFFDEDGKKDPIIELEKLKKTSRFNYMIADISRYCPLIRNANYIRSLFEVKTVLASNEVNDGRPILFRREEKIHPKVFSILGGKIDNIYDILSKLDELLKSF